MLVEVGVAVVVVVLSGVTPKSDISQEVRFVIYALGYTVSLAMLVILSVTFTAALVVSKVWSVAVISSEQPLSVGIPSSIPRAEVILSNSVSFQLFRSPFRAYNFMANL